MYVPPKWLFMTLSAMRISCAGSNHLTGLSLMTMRLMPAMATSTRPMATARSGLAKRKVPRPVARSARVISEWDSSSALCSVRPKLASADSRMNMTEAGMKVTVSSQATITPMAM